MVENIVPKDWQLKELGDLLELIRNGCSNKQVSRITDFPVTRIETISEGKFDLNKVGYVEKIDSNYKIKYHDILISNINSIKHIGKVAIYENKGDLFHGMNLLMLRFDDSDDKRFLYYH